MLGIAIGSTNRILRAHPEVLEGVRPTWHPVAPLGCGSYGCVYSTLDPDVVLKVSTDASEIDFIARASALGEPPEGIVRYYLARAVSSQYYGRTASVIWREAAFDVGEVFALLRRQVHEANRIGDRSKANWLSREINRFEHLLQAYNRNAHAAREGLLKARDPSKTRAAVQRLMPWARDLVSEANLWEDPRTLVGHWRGPARIAITLEASRLLAEILANENAQSYEVGRALEFYLDNGLLLADVHHNNLGRVRRPDYREPVTVITDPGHAIDVGGLL